MPKGKPKNVNQSIASKGLDNSAKLSGRQAASIAKRALKEEGKTARALESGKTRRSAARGAAGTASVSATAANADFSEETRKQYDRKEGQYDGLAMGGIGTSDDPDQVLNGKSDKSPGNTKVWL